MTWLAAFDVFAGSCGTAIVRARMTYPLFEDIHSSARHVDGVWAGRAGRPGVPKKQEVHRSQQGMN